MMNSPAGTKTIIAPSFGDTMVTPGCKVGVKASVGVECNVDVEVGVGVWNFVGVSVSVCVGVAAGVGMDASIAGICRPTRITANTKIPNEPIRIVLMSHFSGRRILIFGSFINFSFFPSIAGQADNAGRMSLFAGR